MSEPKKAINEALLTFNPEKLIKAIDKSLEDDHEPLEILNAITLALEKMGNKFNNGELFLTHLVIAGEAAKKAISEKLEPILKKTNIERTFIGRFVIGTVAGDIHDIGKSIVASMLFSAGFDVIDLGKDVPSEEFIKAIKKYKPDIVGASALITTTRVEQEKLAEMLKKSGLNVKYIVGGAVANAAWAERIGADGYAEDAAEAVKVAKNLIGG